MKTPRKRAATIRNPTMEAIAAGLFRFDEEWEAIRRMENLRAHFIAAKDQEENVWPPTLKIWVRGWEVSEDEAAQGYFGHFGLIRCVPLEGGKFTLKMEKLDVPLTRHPQKKRAPSAHPDWAHPVMRTIAKEPAFATIEEARALLAQLHEEYPKVSIPGLNHLYIMVYRKERQAGELPVQKIKVTIEAGAEQGYVMRWRDNEKRPPRKEAEPAVDGTPPDKTPDGFFTARAKLRRRK